MAPLAPVTCPAAVPDQHALVIVNGESGARLMVDGAQVGPTDLSARGLASWACGRYGAPLELAQWVRGFGCWSCLVSVVR